MSIEPTAGEQLANARQALGLSIDDIAARTRIRRDYLDAIEAMDMRDLPERPYVAGFVRAYAAEVGLDPSDMASLFATQTAPARAVDHGDTFRAPKRPSRAPLMAASAAILTVAIGIIWAGLNPANPADMNEVEPLTDEFREWLAAEPGRAPAPRIQVARVQTQAWALRARISTRIEVRDQAGRVAFAGYLARGELYPLPADQGVRVWAENGGGVELMRGGDNLGPLGLAGVPVTDWTPDLAPGPTQAVEPGG